MKAIEIHEHGTEEVLILREVFQDALKPGKIRVDIKAVGVNRADILLRSGRYQNRTLPIVPGFEASGVVVESAADIIVGTRVLIFDRGNGLYRESAIVDPMITIQIPPKVSYQDAATLPVNWLTADYCVRNLLALNSGDFVLITAAASGVGLAAIQVAKHAGLKVIAAASSSDKLKAAKLCGADFLVDYTKEDLELATHQLTQGKGVHGALDIIGGKYLRPTLKSVRSFGKLVSLANVTGEDSVINTLDFYKKNISILGFQLGELLSSGRWDAKKALQEIMHLVGEGIYHPIIHKTYALSDAAKAHQELESRGVIGKVLLSNEKTTHVE